MSSSTSAEIRNLTTDDLITGCSWVSISSIVPGRTYPWDDGPAADYYYSGHYAIMSVEHDPHGPLVVRVAQL